MENHRTIIYQGDKTRDPVPLKFFGGPEGFRGVLLTANSGCVRIAGGDQEFLAIDCRDLARTAWDIHTNRHVFKRKYGIYTRHSMDLGGGGTQGVEVFHIGDKGNLVTGRIIFVAVFNESRTDDWIYESNLLKDGRKDYEPGHDLGRRKFGAYSVKINMPTPEDLLAWFQGDYATWTQELAPISRARSDLSAWIDSGLNMHVQCFGTYCRKHLRTIPNADLRRQIAPGSSLETLPDRLVCSRCKQTRPYITPVFPPSNAA